MLGRVACAYAVVFYNLAITPGTTTDAVGTALMVLCLVSYALLSTRFAREALTICL